MEQLVQAEARDRRQDDVGGWAGKRHEHRVVAGMAQAVDGHGNGLGPAEDGRAGQREDHRHNDRAERVDVLERIQGEPAGTLGRVVAAPESDHAVADLVEHHGGDEHDEEDQCLLVEDVVAQGERDHADRDRSDDDVGRQPLVGFQRAPMRSGGQRRTEAHSMQRAVAGWASRRAEEIGLPQRAHVP